MDDEKLKILSELKVEVTQQDLQEKLKEIENRKFSGTIHLRLPEEMHKNLAIEAITANHTINGVIYQKINTMILIEDYLKNHS